MTFRFGREVCNNYDIAQSREWLVTNGIGGYACGTIAGVLTRSYHGLLIAACKPPVQRYLLLSKIDEKVNYNGQHYDLASNFWLDGTVAPQGYLNLESFSLEGTTPVWHFAFADGILEKRIWMEKGENTTYIRYTYKRGSQPLSLSLQTLVNYRDHHHLTQGKLLFLVNPDGNQGLEIKADKDAPSLYLSPVCHNSTSQFSWSIKNTWYRNFALAIEQYRGLNYLEDHLLAAIGNITLNPEDAVTLRASTELTTQAEIQENRQQKQQLINLFYDQNKLESVPQWLEQLILAADQFIVDRYPHGKTIMAGYPWFTDWGRDTMIALPGLTIATGRYDIAKNILRTFAQYADQGMLPNVFPDAGETPEYNNVDGTLWYFEAISAYYEATADQELLGELFPLLVEIIDWHIQGTRYRIKMADDGLLYAGEVGVQLTWMDAKVEDWVVTPRIGKPVEVNALWYNALICMVEFSCLLGKSGQKYQAIAEKIEASFAQFWDHEGGYCYDVIDTPEGNSFIFRPNQIFAVSLPSNKNRSLLSVEQQKMVVDKIAQQLLTSYGLRSRSIYQGESFSLIDPEYHGIYGGDRLQRDGSYHQGTVWAWLIGHFVQAHLHVYQDAELARSFLLPMADHLRDGCVGSISEIFDGDVPFSPRGCFAQAWSVAEVIRGWLLVS